MKHMHIRYAALLLFALLSASVSSFAQTVLEQKINAISAIKEIRPLETSEFSEKYVTYFTQPLDHRHPEKGSFRQRVIVSHVGFDRPTVIVTEGYGAAYALRKIGFICQVRIVQPIDIVINEKIENNHDTGKPERCSPFRNPWPVLSSTDKRDRRENRTYHPPFPP